MTLTPSAKLCFRPHPVHDGGEYDSMADLVERLAGEGYGGGIRLLKVAHLLLPRWLKGTPGAEECRPGAHRARGLGRAPAERQGSGADAGAPAGDMQALLGVLRAARGRAGARRLQHGLRDVHTAAGGPVGQLRHRVRRTELPAGLLRRCGAVRLCWHCLPGSGERLHLFHSLCVLPVLYARAAEYHGKPNFTPLAPGQ